MSSMSLARLPNATTSKWEPHKRRIKELFIDQSKKLDEVRCIMETEGFFASKSEYEKQLRKWDLGKNRKSRDMKIIKLKLEARAGRNSESDVYLKGVKLPKLEIQRKAQRCHVSVLDRLELQRCTSPPGLLIITSPSESYMVHVRSKDLPSLRFNRQLDSIGNLLEIINMPNSILERMLPALCPTPSPMISRHVQKMVHYLRAVLPKNQTTDITETLQKIFGGGRHATIEFLKLAVYMLSNKHLSMHSFRKPGPGEIFCDQLIEWFQMERHHLFLRDILSQKVPTVEAFAECIFSSALHDQDEAILRIFLESGVSPNMIVYDRLDIVDYRPLQTLTRRGNLNLIKMFVNSGADINANNPILHDRGSYLQTPLQVAARKGDMDIVKYLVRNGATVVLSEAYGASALQNAAMAGNFEVVKLLLQKGADVDINATYGEYGCALACAILTQADSIVELLLKYGANVNCGSGEHGGTPLECAVEVGNRQMANHLLKQGANVNSDLSGRPCGRTALQWAVRNGDLEICHVLIQAGADVNACARYEESPLRCAVRENDLKIAALLINSGANVNQAFGRVGWRKTALETAISLENVEMVRLLLSANADPNQDESIVYAIKSCNKELIDILLEAGADVTRQSGQFLLAAVETQDVDVVNFWISKGACLDGERTSPLVRAVELANLPIIEALLIAGANCNLYCKKPRDGDQYLNALQMACFKGNTELVLYLLKAGADINWPAAESGGRTAMQAAVLFGDIKLVQSLIDLGANVNAPPAANDWDGVTALQAAVSQGGLDLIQILLQAGAHAEDVPSDKFGLNSLQEASRVGSQEIVQLLLGNGARVNCPGSNYGRTALQAASEMGHYEIVQLLLSKGADVNAFGSFGTALELAAGRGYISIATRLLEAGADVNFKYRPRKTALEAAAWEGRIDMLKLLLEYGTDITSTQQGHDQIVNAINAAREKGHNAAAKFLEYHQIA